MPAKPSSRTSTRRLLAALTLLAGLCASALQGQTAYLPGARTVNDAHNCYPYDGRWNDRVERALATGTPVAIEQDLQWYAPTPGTAGVRVSHGGRLSGQEPTFESYFFDHVRPVVEAALRNPDHTQWPLITLNLDLKSEEPEQLRAIWAILLAHRAWLTSAPRLAGPAAAEELVQPLALGPILVLNGPSAAQQAVFHDQVPAGERLLTFAAVQPGAGHIDPPATNYRRWSNNAWSAVEPAGQANAGTWSPESAARLARLVAHAHEQGLWIRFYTLDGATEEQLAQNGWFRQYNFPTPQAALLRWQAAIAAGVDFLASDQYEQVGSLIRTSRRSPTPAAAR